MCEFIIKSPHGRLLKLSDRPKIMGIVNLTPDSFYEKSRAIEPEKAVEKAMEMIEEGADIIDFGGESTRPGAKPVEESEEIRRVIPVIEAVRRENPDIFISIDTYKSRVAEKAIEAGADMINDISGLGFDPEMKEVIKKKNAPFVINHIKGTPEDMQKTPFYFDVVEEIARFFEKSIMEIKEAGIDENLCILDPGIGFGKRQEDNIEILKNLGRFKVFGRPLMVGHSRKSLIGYLTGGLPPEERLEGTLAITAFLTIQGVQIIRVHDVKENRRVVETIYNFLKARYR